MGSLLAALTTIIVTALAAALAAPYIVDWNQYKSIFEAQAASIFGRAVRIDGEVGLTILPVPEVHLKGLRVADETGSFKTPFAEAENFAMELSLAPLLSGTIEARDITLDQPVLRLRIDADGRGNWASIGPAPGASGIPARDIVLHNVIIKDGAVEYREAPGAAASRIDQISGSFSADSLSGPFRFSGFGAIGREKRELKFSASRASREGGLRLKASMSSATGGSLYQLDGDLKSIAGTPQYTGPVLARLELGAASAPAGKGDRQAPPPQPQRSRAIELRANAALTLQDARLQDIALTVTENDRPQSLTGSAYASWGAQPRLDLSVQTAFLDIDQMAGTTGGKPNPLAAVALLPQIFQGWAFDPREGRIKATIQQANLGGDIVEGLTFSATHNREFWQVETLEARLPGDASLAIQGILRPGDQIGFTGDVNLSGKNLSRMLRWAAPGLGAVDTGDAQTFSLKGGLTFAEQRVTLRRASGQLGDSKLSGDLAYDYSENSKLLLTLQSDRLDLRAIYGGNPFAANAPAQAAQAQPAADEPTAADQPAVKTSLLDAFRTVFAAKQSQISLRIAQLTMPDLEARDVRSEFRYENGTLDIREFNLATTDGLSAKADGQLTNFETSPNGTINLSVNAPSTASVANLAKLFGVESFGTAARRRMDALAPLKVTGRLGGNRQDHTLNLTLAGNAAGSELTFAGRFDGDLKALSEARLDLGGTIANSDGRKLIAQLAPEAQIAQEGGRAGAGVLTISAEGPLKSGLESRLELRTPDAEGRFDGRVGVLDEPWSLKGDVWLRAGQASTALAMLRLSPGGSPVTGDLDLRAALTKSASKFQVANLTLQLGGQTISGSANIDLAGARPVIDAEAKAANLSLPKLAAYLVDWDRKDLSAIAENLVNGNPWPNQSFSFRNFAAVDGTLKVRAPAITLNDGLTLANGQFDASLKDAVLNVEALKGQLYGGTFTGSGTLAAAEGRALLKGAFRLDKADLARLTLASDGKPLVRSTGELRLAFNGEGLSPRGLMTVLAGKGRIRINRGILSGLSPAVLGQAADAYLAEEIPQQNRIAVRIARDLRQGQFPFRGFIAPVVVKDGVLEVRKAGFKSPDGLATANLMVDLQSLKIDSEWTVSYRGKTKSGATLPPVTMVFAGPLSSFASLQPQLQTEAYERALSSQRMDRDMDRLEKLNRPPAVLPPASSNALPPAVAPTSLPPSAAGPTNAIGAAAPAPGPVDAVPTRPTAAPPQPDTTTGWSTGLEEAPPASPHGAPHGQIDADAVQKPPRDFEDEIRRVLQEQQKGAPQPAAPVPQPGASPAAPPAGPRSSLSYQTESYSHGIPDVTHGVADDAASADAAADSEAAAPLPERKPPEVRAHPKKPTALQQFFDIFQ